MLNIIKVAMAVIYKNVLKVAVAVIYKNFSTQISCGTICNT